MKMKTICFISLFLVIALCGYYYNSWHIKKGITKEKALKILNLRDNKKFSGMKLRSQTKLIEVVFCEDKGSGNINLGDEAIDRVLILVFENGKLSSFGKGRNKYSAILQEYPEIADFVIPKN